MIFVKGSSEVTVPRSTKPMPRFQVIFEMVSFNQLIFLLTLIEYKVNTPATGVETTSSLGYVSKNTTHYIYCDVPGSPCLS